MEDEVELCKKYVDAVKIRRSNFDVTFHDYRSIMKKDIILPHHILNNFSKNAIEKGKIIGQKLNIVLEDKILDGNYIVTLSNDGDDLPEGFNIYQLPESSTGLRNIQEQINYFNSSIEIPYAIELRIDPNQKDSVLKLKTGVTVQLTFKQKTNEI